MKMVFTLHESHMNTTIHLVPLMEQTEVATLSIFIAQLKKSIQLQKFAGTSDEKKELYFKKEPKKYTSKYSGSSVMIWGCSAVKAQTIG